MLGGVVTMDAKKVISYSDLDILLRTKGVALKDKFPGKTDMVVKRKMTPDERKDCMKKAGTGLIITGCKKQLWWCIF